MSAKSTPWTTRSLIKRSAPLADDPAYQRALEQIERMNESAGMKHLLADYVTDLRLENKKIPDKLLSRKQSAAFQESIEKTVTEDKGLFEISGMISMICAVLVCMFIKAVLMDRYVVNFSVDALIAAVALAFLILNLRSQWKTIRFYGSVRDYIVLDGLAVLLWIGLTWLYPPFDTSLVVFLLAYFVEKSKFKKQRETFLEENGLPSGPDKVKA